MKNLTILCIVVGLFLGACIRKECRDIPGGYEFEIPVTLAPAKDTFRVGDTIHVSSIFSDEVFELKTQQHYTLREWRFFPETRIDRIDLADSAVVQDGLSDFTYLPYDQYDYEKFNYSSGNIGLVGEYLYTGEEYRLEYRLIPRKQGLYYFAHLSIQSKGDDQDFPGRCSNITSETHVVLNGRMDNNSDFLSYSPQKHYSEWMLLDVEARFDNHGGYCFYVVE
jgi:hypothetical protein